MSKQIKILIFSISGVCFEKGSFLQWIAQGSVLFFAFVVVCFFFWSDFLPRSDFFYVVFFKPSRHLATTVHAIRTWVGKGLIVKGSGKSSIW